MTTFREYCRYRSELFEMADVNVCDDMLVIQCDADGKQTLVSGFKPDGTTMSVAEARGLVHRAWDALRTDEETGKHGQPLVAVGET